LKKDIKSDLVVKDSRSFSGITLAFLRLFLVIKFS